MNDSVTVSWRRKLGERRWEGGPLWATAEYLCDGIDDQIEIQAAIDSLPSHGGVVILDDGPFNITGEIRGRPNVRVIPLHREAR